MRKWIVSAFCLFIVLMSACTCTLEKASLERLEANMKLQEADHKALMVQVKRSDDDKNDWAKQYTANYDLINGLKKSAK
jgi:hypothetical protein